MFGIEAVKQFLRDEYGSLVKVNPRHLELLIDSMTVSGDIQRVTRNGIDRKTVGPIAKMSFEQPMECVQIAASNADIDPLRSVAGCIVFGKMARIGTNYMDVIPFDKYRAMYGEEKVPKRDWEDPEPIEEEEEHDEFADMVGHSEDEDMNEDQTFADMAKVDWAAEEEE